MLEADKIHFWRVAMSDDFCEYLYKRDWVRDPYSLIGRT